MPNLLSRPITPHLYTRLVVHHPARLSSTCTQALKKHVLDSPLSGHHPTLNEDGKPMRQRRNGFKSLPLSPLMQERSAGKSQRHSELATDELEEMQKEVATNPYAHALASPIRSCNITMARLPSHFLLPFTTTISRGPPAANDREQLPKVKALLQPGRGSDHVGDRIAQTSHVVNRQDMVRHLSRKKHWTILITERQRAKLASIARRSPSSNKFVQDHWVWEDKVDAVARMLEEKVVDTARRAMKTSSASDNSSEKHSDTMAFAMRLGAQQVELRAESKTTPYELPALLSPKALQTLRDSTEQDSSGIIYISQSVEACQAHLALERLKAYKESNEILKELPMKQNTKGSREARLLRGESELGHRPTEEEGQRSIA